MYNAINVMLSPNYSILYNDIAVLQVPLFYAGVSIDIVKQESSIHPYV